MEIENSILLTAVRNPFKPHSSRLILKREYKVQTVGEYIKEIFPIPPEDIEIIASVSNIGIVDLDYIPLPQTNIVFTTIPAGGGLARHQIEEASHEPPPEFAVGVLRHHISTGTYIILETYKGSPGK